jgi:hypothetical protein
MTVGNQTVLQVDAAEARHLNIRDQACRSHYLRRFKEFLRRTKRHSSVTEGPYKGLCGFPYRFIIVDNRDHGRPTQFQTLGSHSIMIEAPTKCWMASTWHKQVASTQYLRILNSQLPLIPAPFQRAGDYQSM